MGQVADRSGVAVSAVHFYESKGLIASRRNAGNQRRYARDVLRRVAIIKVAQRIGIPLASVGEALATLPAGKDAHRKGLAPHVGGMESRSGCAHRETADVARSTQSVHRLRLPVDQGLPFAQSG